MFPTKFIGLVQSSLLSLNNYYALVRGCALGIVLQDSYSQQRCWFPLALNTLLFKVILMRALSMP